MDNSATAATEAMRALVARTDHESEKSSTDALARKEREQDRIDAAVQAVTRSKQQELDSLRESMGELERAHVALKVERMSILDNLTRLQREYSGSEHARLVAQQELEQLRKENAFLKEKTAVAGKVKPDEYSKQLQIDNEVMLKEKLELLARVRELETQVENTERLLSTAEGEIRRREDERIQLVQQREKDEKDYKRFVEWTAQTLRRYGAGLARSYSYIQEQVDATQRMREKTKEKRLAELENQNKQAEAMLEEILSSGSQNQQRDAQPAGAAVAAASVGSAALACVPPPPYQVVKQPQESVLPQLPAVSPTAPVMLFNSGHRIAPTMSKQTNLDMARHRSSRSLTQLAKDEAASQQAADTSSNEIADDEAVMAACARSQSTSRNRAKSLKRKSRRFPK